MAKKSSGTPAVFNPMSIAAEVVLLVPDLLRLQEIQYDAVPAEAAEYARTQDMQYPLWSITHQHRANPDLTVDGHWKVNWQNVAQMYIYHGLHHDEVARYSNIPKRSIEAHSGKYGWAQARRTRRVLAESEATPDLKDLEETVRKEKIAEFLTQSGFEIGRHAMQALLQNVDKIEPRDVAPLLTAASKILSMGTGMPESYRHSRVENPLAAGAQQNPINILNITSDKAEELLASLRERAKVLEDARAIPSTVADPSTRAQTP